MFGLRFAYLQAVIFFAFFLLVVRFGRFCRLSRKWEDLKCTEKFLLYLKTPNLVSVNQYNNLDVLLKNLSPSVHFGVHWVGWFFKYARHPLFMFGLRNAALQTGIGRPGELLFLDLYFGLLTSSRDPNFTGGHLFRLGVRVVDIIHRFYSRTVIQRQIVASPALWNTVW